MSQASFPESAATTAPTIARRTGLWTPIILTLLSGAFMTLPNRIFPGSFEAVMVMFYGPMLCFLLFLIWWFSFSRMTWTEKFFGLGGVIVVSVTAALFAHPTMLFALMLYLPVLMMVFWTLGIALFRHQLSIRRLAIPIGLLPAALITSAVRFEGIDGEFNAQFKWRGSKTAEEEYLASRDAKPAAKVAPADVKPLELAAGDWSGFRGPNRDSVVRGVRIRTDWNQNPPKQLWRRKIGPGWSSFAVVGNRAFTQEQRASDEVVVCFDLDNGEEVWLHVDHTRFDEPVGGAGPRATPTFADGRLFTLGANGHLNAFDAASGKLIWGHDLATKHKEDLKKELSGMEKPMWGFSASPLVVGDKVAVYVGAKEKGVAVYNAADGKEAWTSGIGGHSYTSTHLATLAGAATLLNTSNHGVQGLDPATGKELWNHVWELGEVVPCVQPTLLDGDRVAIGAAFGKGTRLFQVAKSGDGYTTEALATHVAFKPYYSDYVMIGDTAFGFDGPIFGCFDLKTGKRIWKGGRYGSGQVLLLADQNLLLIISEIDGNVVLIPADKSGHKEIAKFKALTGKTWNHPVVAHGKLLVRNGEEIACFDVAEK
jgi:outer membrane protein assembly factor BamB